MAFTEALRLLVTADTQGAVRGIQQVGTAADRSLGRSQKSIDKWGHTLTRAGAAGLAFGGLAAVGLFKAAQSASDLEEAGNKVGEVFGPAAGKVEDFAAKAQKIGLSKKAALDAAGGFGNLFDQVGFADDAAADMSTTMVGLASDFASFHNADITQVLEAQSAAFRGEFDAVQRFVPTLNAAAVQQRAMADSGKANAAALTEAEKAAATYALIIEGAGKAQGDFERTSGSAANQQRRLSASFENLKASIGEGALPVMETFLDVANKGVGIFQGLDSASGGLLGKLAAFGTVGLVSASGLSLVVGQLITMRGNLRTATDALSGMVGRLGGLRRLLVGGGIVAGIGVLVAGLKQIEEQRAAERLEDFFVALKRGGDVNQEFFEKTLLMGAAFGDLDDKLRDVAANSGLAAAERFVHMAEAAGASDEAMRVLNAELAGLQGESSAAADDVGELGGAMGDQAAGTEQAASAITEYNDALAALFDPVFAAISAADSAADAIAAEAEAQVALNEALAGGDPTAIAEATEALDDAHRGAAEAGFAHAASERELAEKLATGEVKVADLEAELGRLEAQGYGSGASAAWLRDRIAELKSKRVDITVRSNTSSVVGAVISQLNRIPQVTRRTIEFQTRGGLMSGLQVRQHGGPVEAGRAYLVGEKRPEVFVPDRDGMVLPGVESLGHMVTGPGGGGGGTVINLNVDMRGSVGVNEDQFRQMVAHSWNKAARLGLVTVQR